MDAPEDEDITVLEDRIEKFIRLRMGTSLDEAARKAVQPHADDLLKRYTREMNSARQAAITQEISEIVGGANALAEAGSDV